MSRNSRLQNDCSLPAPSITASSGDEDRRGRRGARRRGELVRSRRSSRVRARARVRHAAARIAARRAARRHRRAPSPSATAQRMCLRLIATRGDRAGVERRRAFDAPRRSRSRRRGADVRRDRASAAAPRPPRPPRPPFFSPIRRQPGGPRQRVRHAYDVRSVFGFGADGEARLERWCSSRSAARGSTLRTVRLFEIVALYAAGVDRRRRDARHLRRGYDRAIATLEDLVALQERLASDASAEHGGRSSSAARRAARRQGRGWPPPRADASSFARSARCSTSSTICARRASRSRRTVEIRTRELATRQPPARSAQSRARRVRLHRLARPAGAAAHRRRLPADGRSAATAATLGVEADEFIRFAIEGAQRMQALIESLLALLAGDDDATKQLEPLPLDEALDVALRTWRSASRRPSAAIERDAAADGARRSHADGAAVPEPAVERHQVRRTASRRASTSSARCARRRLTHHGARRGHRLQPAVRRPHLQDLSAAASRHAGTGIGLAVCKKIVERHGGRIDADVEPGEGATFTFVFPFERAAR